MIKKLDETLRSLFAVANYFSTNFGRTQERLAKDDNTCSGPNFNPNQGFMFPPKLVRILVKQKNTLQTERKPPLAVYMMLLKIICIWINIIQIYLSDIKRRTLFKITTELLKTRTFVLQPTEK